MSLLLIDDQGQFWRGESRQLRAAYDSPYSGGEFVEYAVKNLGFVAINVYGASCQLRLRPNFIGIRVVEALRDWLSATKIERVVLTTFETGWKDEFVPAARIHSRLETLVESEKTEQLPDFLATPLPISALSSRPLLSDIVLGWPHITATYETETLVRLLKAAFNQRYVIVSKPAAQEKVLFHEFGANMFPHYETWRNCAIGAPIEEQFDRSYGRWVGKVYQETLGSHASRLDAVDAMIRCPIRGRMRHRYKRLIFPLACTSTGDLFLGGSYEDASIDLRITSA